MNTHCGVSVQWKSLRKPTGLSRSCRPPLGISGDSRAAGLPSVSGHGSSRKRARPSLSVKRMTCVNVDMAIRRWR